MKTMEHLNGIAMAPAPYHTTHARNHSGNRYAGPAAGQVACNLPPAPGPVVYTASRVRVELRLSRAAGRAAGLPAKVG
jgi:hypothetical protein